MLEILGRDPRLGPPKSYEGNAALYDAASQQIQADGIVRAIPSGQVQEYELQAPRPGAEPSTCTRSLC
jgi:hypothetical protein